MGTQQTVDHLAAALFGRTRRAVLSLLLSHPDESFYLREVARNAGAGQGAAQRELQRLEQAGIIRRFARGRQVFFQANHECPIFAELRGIVLKTAGVADVLRAALQTLVGRVRLAFVYGSVARGQPRQDSDVDLCIVGAVTFAEVVNALGPAQEKLAREVNPTVYPPAEFTRKLAAGHHFVTSLARDPKLFLIGDERELARVAQEPTAGAAPDQSAGDRRAARRRRPRPR